MYVEGKLQTRKWQDQSGNDRYSTEIVLQGFQAQLVMLDGPANGQRDGAGRGGSGGSGSRSGISTGGFADDLDDDVPF